LVPRPETETLVEWALGLLPARRDGVRLRALDLGTGSGAIACALAAERGDVEVIASDVSQAAAVVARENARRLGLAGRVRVVVADLADALGRARADLIVSNPPYPPSVLVGGLEPEIRCHEPRVALDGGDDGLAALRRIVVSTREALRATPPCRRGRLRPCGRTRSRSRTRPTSPTCAQWGGSSRPSARGSPASPAGSACRSRASRATSRRTSSSRPCVPRSSSSVPSSPAT